MPLILILYAFEKRCTYLFKFVDKKRERKKEFFYNIFLYRDVRIFNSEIDITAATRWHNYHFNYKLSGRTSLLWRDTLFRQLENSKPTQTRTTAEDGVLKKFRCHESVATNSSRGRVFVFTSHTALSPRNYVLRELNARQLLGGRR